MTTYLTSSSASPIRKYSYQVHNPGNSLFSSRRPSGRRASTGTRRVSSSSTAYCRRLAATGSSLSMHKTAPTIKHPRKFGQPPNLAVPDTRRRSTPPERYCGSLRLRHKQIRHSDVLLTVTGPRSAAGGRRLPAPWLAVKPSARHREQVAARRREKHFGAESLRHMVGRHRKSEKSEDTLRRDDTHKSQLWHFSKRNLLCHNTFELISYLMVNLSRYR
jgi:hypothetical protein